MINFLSYVGMNIQSELCLWTLLGLMRTIFDATLFKVNSNLKQVWQMAMPDELSLPVQRVLRTVISGVMLVQCFTVYVYLASYIVLLYPVFLEERPTLALPWLLLAAIRRLLCELTSLSLGLGTCVLLGPARPPCIKFLVVKLVSIMPAFYMWMLVYSYYHILKLASAFKTFPQVLPSTDHDYGLELAVRRRRTKSLFGEDQLRKKIEASFYNDRNSSLIDNEALPRLSVNLAMLSNDPSFEDMKDDLETLQPMSATSNRLSDEGCFEDWFGNEVVIPRDTDRIMEQFVLMMLRISVYLNRDGSESMVLQNFTPRPRSVSMRSELECPDMSSEDIESPRMIRSRQGSRPSYLRDYPELFTKKSSDRPVIGRRLSGMKTVQNRKESDAEGNVTKQYRRAVSVNSHERISLEIERVVNRKQSAGKYNKRNSTSKAKTSEITDQHTKDMDERFNEMKDSQISECDTTQSENTSVNKENVNYSLLNNKSSEEDIHKDEKNKKPSSRSYHRRSS